MYTGWLLLFRYTTPVDFPHLEPTKKFPLGSEDFRQSLLTSSTANEDARDKMPLPRVLVTQTRDHSTAYVELPT